MKDEERQAPEEETPDDGATQAEQDADEVEAHGGWGGVGRPDS